MALKQTLFYLSLAAAALALGISFTLAGRLPLALSALLPVMAMLVARRPSQARPGSLLGSLALGGFTSLAAVGLLLRLPLPPMLLAACAALAAWDLLLELPHPSDPLRDHRHLITLAVSLSLAILTAILGSFIHWQAPFLVMLALVSLAFLALERIIRVAAGRPRDS